MRLAHDELGCGPAVVLLHAGIADRRMWADHLPAVAEAGARAVALDLPGFGDSPLGAVFAPWEDVLETLDGLEIERAVLVGNSFGGACALSAALTEPGRVAGLVLISSPSPGMQPSEMLEAVWQAEEEALERGDIGAAVEAILDGWLAPGVDPEVRALVATMQRRAFELQQRSADPEEPEDPLEASPEALAELRVPALVAWGERDMPDFQQAGEWLAGRLPEARRHEFTGAGHLAPLERPDEFRSVLQSFLAEIMAQWPTTRISPTGFAS